MIPKKFRKAIGTVANGLENIFKKFLVLNFSDENNRNIVKPFLKSESLNVVYYSYRIVNLIAESNIKSSVVIIADYHKQIVDF